MKWGKLRLRTLALLPAPGTTPTTAAVALAGKPLDARLTLADGRATITLAAEATIEAGEELAVTLA